MFRLLAPILAALLLCATACNNEVTDETGSATGAATEGTDSCAEVASDCTYQGKRYAVGTKIGGLTCQKGGLWRDSTEANATDSCDKKATEPARQGDDAKPCAYQGKQYAVGTKIAGLTCQKDGLWR